MWWSETRPPNGPVTFAALRRRPSRQVVEIRAQRDMSNLTARQLAPAWAIMREYLDVLLSGEGLTTTPVLTVASSDDEETDEAKSTTTGFEVGSVFIKTNQRGRVGRRHRTYEPLGHLSRIVDDRWTDAGWCNVATVRPEAQPVERPTAIHVLVTDGGGGRDKMSLRIRDMTMYYLRPPAEGLLSLRKENVGNAKTIYLVSTTLYAGEVELRLRIRDRERIVYQAKPTPVAVSYRKLRLNTRARVIAPKRTVVSMSRVSWIHKAVVREGPSVAPVPQTQESTVPEQQTEEVCQRMEGMEPEGMREKLEEHAKPQVEQVQFVFEEESSPKTLGLAAEGPISETTGNPEKKEPTSVLTEGLGVLVEGESTEEKTESDMPQVQRVEMPIEEEPEGIKSAVLGKEKPAEDLSIGQPENRGDPKHVSEKGRRKGKQERKVRKSGPESGECPSFHGEECKDKEDEDDGGNMTPAAPEPILLS